MAFDAVVNGEHLSFDEDEVCESCEQRTRVANIATRSLDYVTICAPCLREIADAMNPASIVRKVPDTEPPIDPPASLGAYRVQRKNRKERTDE